MEKIFDTSSYQRKQRERVKTHEGLRRKIRDVIRSITNNSHDQDEKYT